jgi:hypothetical protein
MNLVAVIYNGGIYTSTDSGVTWAPQTNAPSTSLQSVASDYTGTKLVAVTSAGSIYTYNSNSTIWTSQTPPMTVNQSKVLMNLSI